MAGIDREDDENGDHGTPFGGLDVGPQPSGVIHGSVARVAFELATTPEGRVAGLSVEVWPERGVLLGTRDGHELHVLIEQSNDVVQARWEHVAPSSGSDRPAASHGSLGDLHLLVEDDLRTLIASWLARRAGG
jgi:hypothetical protein